MKFIEPFKSFLLFFLILSSLVLTVVIWNYKPNLEFIEEPSMEKVLSNDKKLMNEIIKPYKAVSRTDETLNGSTSPNFLDNIYDFLQNKQATDLTLVNNNLADEQINDLMDIDNRLMIFYNTEVPLRNFLKVLPFASENIPEMSFDRVIFDWNDLSSDKELSILFVNTVKKTMYRTAVINQSETQVTDSFIKPIDNFTPYVAVGAENSTDLELYVPSMEIDAVKYIITFNETSIEQYKNVLFEDESIVQKSNESPTMEKYMDSISILYVDTKNYVLNYVYPGSEGFDDMEPSNLVEESFSFINDHGGFNADYRISAVNTDKHLVEYQFYYQGLPVFSDETSTKISTTWGDYQLHKYRRPYYVFEMDIPGEMKIKKLPSGEAIYEQYGQNVKNLKDIVVGYHLVQNTDPRVFELEPAWFVLKENSWEHIKPDGIGGQISGLE